MQIINGIGRSLAKIFGPSIPGNVRRGPQPATPYYRARYIRNRSCYQPHQGERERLRRRIGGFAGVANMAEDLGIPRAEALARIDEFHTASA